MPQVHRAYLPLALLQEDLEGLQGEVRVLGEEQLGGDVHLEEQGGAEPAPPLLAPGRRAPVIVARPAGRCLIGYSWTTHFKLVRLSQPMASMRAASLVKASTAMVLWNTCTTTTPLPRSQMARIRATFSEIFFFALFSLTAS